MSQQVWKYPLKDVPRVLQQIEMPASSSILHLQMQGEIPTLWVLVFDNNNPEVRTFVIVGTGSTLPEDGTYVYVGTYQHSWYVGHVFEKLSAVLSERVGCV